MNEFPQLVSSKLEFWILIWFDILRKKYTYVDFVNNFRQIFVPHN